MLEIGGVSDHVHLLAQPSASLAVADVVRDIKANSSRWMNELPGSKHAFEWQKGYGAFAVSYIRIPKVREYIQKQKEHHTPAQKAVSFDNSFVRLGSIVFSGPADVDGMLEFAAVSPGRNLGGNTERRLIRG